ncbi:MAG: virulence protein RhuM/Fic/DOC family protein [Spirochaetaceae bacterium]|nr:virulence protein RhuM/Fic/DOC family protein [Spirochaetaceae bacterium]
MESNIVIFQDKDIKLEVPISLEKDTVWLTANQMAELFDKDEKTIRKHINNIFEDEELDYDNNTQKMRVVGVKQKVPFYTLDVIFSVGYRVKSKRGILFRRWANSVLKEYLIKGYALNQKRLEELSTVINIISRSSIPEISGVASVLDFFTKGLNILDDYDHQVLKKPSSNDKNNSEQKESWQLTYEEGRKVIESMRFAETSSLFGNEKDNSFKSTLGAIYQTFGGKDVYPTLEEKAANLLYMLVKNHSFNDGNKRIAAALFIYFLERNNLLFDKNKNPIIDNNTLAAMTLMIALSKPEEKEIMCLLVLNMLNK